MTSTFLESLYQEEIYKINGKVMVILPKPWESISDEEKILLSKILWAVKLTLASVQIITRQAFVLEDFKAYSPVCIIAFGASLKNVTTMYEHISMNNISIVLADELHRLDDQKKRNLWLTLKQLFKG